MERGPFVVESVQFDDLENEGHMAVRVRRYPAGPVLEFDLSTDVRDEVLQLILDAHAKLAFELAKRATQ